MTEEEMIWTASVAIGKGYDYEILMNSDYMYGKERFIDDVWPYVEECQNIGEVRFKEKYSSFNLFI